MRRTATGSGRSLLRYVDALRLKANGLLPVDVSVGDQDGAAYRFRCHSADEYGRATRMLDREPGTIAFLREELRPGDHVVDVGANIGVFTIFAAQRVGADGRVSASEPHLRNAASLLDNVALNGVHDRVDVLSCALGGRDGVLPFDYGSLVAGTALSTLRIGDAPLRRAHAATELKVAKRFDQLVRDGVVPRPDIIKIDVDGNEPDVLDGMRDVLSSGDGPRAVQVELNPDGSGATARAILDACGYELSASHRSVGAEAAIARGDSPDRHGVNGIFRPKG